MARGGGGGGGGGLFEGGDYFKYFGQRGTIIRGRRLIERRLLFEEIRYSYSGIVPQERALSDLFLGESPRTCQWFEKKLYQTFRTAFHPISKQLEIDNFRVALNLIMKARLSAKFLL